MSRMKGWDQEVTQFSSVIPTEYRHHLDPQRVYSKENKWGKRRFPLDLGKPRQQPSMYLFYLVTPMASKLVSN